VVEQEKQSTHFWRALWVMVPLKVLFFIAFICYRNPETRPSLLSGDWALKGGDTETYYFPLHHLYLEGQYSAMCRMPGLAPVYLPLRAIMTHEQTLDAIIVVQLIADIIATYLLALLCYGLFQNRRAFWFCVGLGTLSSFVLVRANYLLADSFGCSAIVIAAWLLYRWSSSSKLKFLLWSGVFFAWALFLRQIFIVIIPFVGLLIAYYSPNTWGQRIKFALLFFVPLAMALGTWTIRNRINFNRNVVLVAPLEECMRQLTPEFLAVRTMMLSMGQDAQPWIKGSAAHWFFTPMNDCVFPIEERKLSARVTVDSLTSLRNDYWKYTTEEAKNDSLRETIIARANRYTQAYKEEHPIQHAFTDKVHYFFYFLFPMRLDDFPFPRFDLMPLGIKAMEAGNLILLWLIHALSLIAALFYLLKKKINLLLWGLLGFVPIAVLSYFGWVEQRYLATSSYFLILMAAGFAAMLFDLIFPSRALRSSNDKDSN